MTDFEREDKELQGIMGDHFQDLTEAPVKAEPEKVSTNTTHAENEECKPAGRVKTAIWSPFNAEPSFTQKLMNCAKWASLFSALYALFYYWQCTGQMLPSASGPSMTACAIMVGWSFGKYAFRGKR